MKFYENELYIDMCRKAEEIQDSKPYDPYQRRYKQFFVGDRGASVDEFGEWWNIEKWMPRLDQLIEMIEGGVGATLWHIARWEDEYSADMVCPYVGSWETLVLGYLMETKYGKKWDFEKREWVRV